MAQYPQDPIGSIMIQMGKLRGTLFSEAVTLPAPSPLRRSLEDLDRMIGRFEGEILDLSGKTYADIDRLIKQGPIPLK